MRVEAGVGKFGARQLQGKCGGLREWLLSVVCGVFQNREAPRAVTPRQPWRGAHYFVGKTPYPPGLKGPPGRTKQACIAIIYQLSPPLFPHHPFHVAVVLEQFALCACAESWIRTAAGFRTLGSLTPVASPMGRRRLPLTGHLQPQVRPVHTSLSLGTAHSEALVACLVP